MKNNLQNQGTTKERFYTTKQRIYYTLKKLQVIRASITLSFMFIWNLVYSTGSDSFTVKTARTVAEAEKLLELGFE